MFKSAATAATTRPGPIQDGYHHLIAGGMRESLARVTLTRKLATITLRLWKTGEHLDANYLTIPHAKSWTPEVRGAGGLLKVP